MGWNEPTAVWVQAVATILALVVAVGAPIWASSIERKRVNKDKVNLANDLINAFVGDLTIIAMRSAFIAPLLSGQRNAQRAKDCDELMIRIPPRIEALVFDRSDVDRKTIEPVTKIVQVVNGYNGYLELMRRTQYQGNEDRIISYDQLEQRRILIGRLAGVVVEPIQKALRGE